MSSKWGPLDCGQNLPAVLNDPKKGKQRDFFTRSWGDSFVETASIGSSPHLCELPSDTFDRYIKKLKKHKRTRRNALNPSVIPGSSPASPSSKPIPSIYGIPKLFMDPNFDLTKPETFACVFPFLMNSSRDGLNRREFRASSLASDSKDVHEGLSQHLDVVEMNLAHQLAQKSHHFFQIMTYQDALMSQLTSLLKVVKDLRCGLRDLKNSVSMSLKISQLKRRQKNCENILENINLMSSLRSTQPTIQLLLSTSEFSGALDLITTSREVLQVELKGVVSFRYLSSQLEEIQSVIGKMLLSDFRTYIAREVQKETLQIKATFIFNSENWRYDDDVDANQMTSVIYGLLRQNSFTFLEALEEASISAVEGTINDVITSLLPATRDHETCLTTLVKEFARMATSEGWTDLFDILIGSLIALLRRILSIHGVIVKAIKTCNDVKESSNNQVIIPDSQKKSLEVSSHQVLLNVSDHVAEKCAVLLGLRSKPATSSLITVKELTDIESLISILTKEIKSMVSGKTSTSLQLTLQSQSLLYIQSFDEKQREKLICILDKEKWNNCKYNLEEVESKCSKLPGIFEIFSFKKPGVSHTNGHGEANGGSQKGKAFKVFLSGGDSYEITQSALEFLYIIIDYCILNSKLSGVNYELGYKLADIFKFFNSRACQLILGAAAVKVGDLSTITIYHLCLTLNTVDFIPRFIPIVTEAFISSNSVPSKQSDGLARQFKIARKDYLNHSEEIIIKIISIVNEIQRYQLSTWTWNESMSIPSDNFRTICKQLNLFHDILRSNLRQSQVVIITRKVHSDFLAEVKKEIRLRKFKPPGEDPKSRFLLSEMVYYGHRAMRITDIIPPEETSSEFFEKLWL